ncbi:MAG: mannose-1-phosphate guanylyltransferase [Sediminibacterium sp.]|nr:mannose-1-phosphate guanylyltransferase [Sediminibacterium sp.]
MQQNENYYLAIMAGGIGSRFWPKSRNNYPKQFIDILGTGKTLIQDTFDRFKSIVPLQNIFVITAQNYTDFVKNQIPELPVENILAEPSRKNTAPCIAYISFKLSLINPNATLIVTPSDHNILNVEEFLTLILKGCEFVTKSNSILTLGIKPNHPNTGYGYIQIQDNEVDENVYKVKTFTEKPNIDLAKMFLKSGDFFWNAGIFIWKTSTILDAFKTFQPQIYEAFDQEKSLFNTTEEFEALQKIFPQCPNIPIDVAILEKADNVFMIKSDVGWNDLGTWNSLYDNIEKDYFGNAVSSKDNVILIDATNSMVSSEKEKLVIIQGLDEFIVVDTPDILLICKKSNEQAIKDYVSEIKTSKRTKFL